MPFINNRVELRCVDCGELKNISTYYYSTFKRGIPYCFDRCKECYNKNRGLKKLSKLTIIEDLPNEKWVYLNDNKYAVSNMGRYKIQSKYSTLLSKLPVNSVGYCVVGLFINNKYVHKTLHRLVAETFIKNPKKYPTVNHKNGIKTDNRVENLEWSSYAYNNKHARITGLNKGSRGETTGSSKLTNFKVADIFNSKDSVIDLAKKYRVHVSTIYAIKTGERWSHVTHKIIVKRDYKRLITHKNEEKCLTEWAKYFKITHSTLHERLKRGQTFEDIHDYYNKKNNGI